MLLRLQPSLNGAQRQERRHFISLDCWFAALAGPLYFIAAWLALPVSTPEGVAEFWPAAGIAVGALLIASWRWRLLIVASVFAASFAANALAGQCELVCITFAIANAGEAVLVTALIERGYKRPFELDRLMNVVGLFTAAIIGTALWEAAAAATLGVAGQTSAPFVFIWSRLVWANVTGIVMTAPLLLGLAAVARRRPPRQEVAEGLAVLGLHGFASLHAFGLILTQFGHWMLLVPRSVQLPLLLWLALRCGPLFAAAGTFLLGATTMASMLLGAGEFAGTVFPLSERALASQYAMLAMSFVALSIAALIAERKEAEYAARRSEARLKLSLDAGKLGTFEFDPETGHFDVSDTARSCFGLLPGSPLTLDAVRGVLQPADRVQWESRFWKALEEGGRLDSEFRIMWPNGTTHWLHMMARASHSAGSHLVGAVRDITEQKSMTSLKESAEQLRLFVEQAPVAIAMLDLDMRYIAASERWIRKDEVDHRGLIGRSHYEDFPNLPESWKEAHRRALGGETVREEQALIPRADNRLQWGRWEVRPWRAASGDIGGILIFCEDVTDRVLAERALRDSRRDLDRAQAVAQMGSWRFDAGRQELIMSDQLRRIYGDVNGPPTYKYFLSSIHPDDRERVNKCWKAALKGEPYDIECRLMSGERIKWVHVKAELEFDSSGRLLSSFGTVQDISANKQAENKLRESEERLRLSNEAAQIGAFTIYIKAGCVLYSPELATMLGFPGLETTNIRDAFTSIHRDDVQRVRTLYNAALEGENGGHLKMNFRFVRPGGEVRWIDWAGRVDFRDGPEGREPFRVVGACVDITGLKRAEEALRQSEERLRHLGDSLPNSAVYQYSRDAQGYPRFNYISAGIEQLTGVRPEEALASADAILHKILPDYLQPLFEAERRSADQLSDIKLEVPMRHTNGEVRWMRLQARPRRLPDGGVIWDGVQTDITGLKKAEDALRDSEERLRAIVDTAADAIVVIDEAGLIQSINPAGERMFGYTAAELNGRDVSTLLPSPHREAHDRYFRAYCESGEGKMIGSHEVDHLRKDGSIFPGDLSVAEWHVGNRRFFTGTIRDSTERNEHDQKVQLLLREVNHRAKNLLALVRAIASQTASPAHGKYVRSFTERLSALAASQDLLVRSGWQGVDIGALVHSQLSHFESLIGKRIGLSGPCLMLSAAAAQTIGMALHELATNAGKYGALSNSDGTIGIAWSLSHDPEAEQRFVMTWTEDGGPQVSQPEKSGFGTTVIGLLPRMELDADVRLEYNPKGFRWSLACPSESVLETPDNADPSTAWLTDRKGLT